MKKVHYELTNFADYWWDVGRGKWSKNIKRPHKGLSSHRRLGTDGNKAWKIFRKMPLGFILIKYFKYKGKRYMQEWPNYIDN